MRNRKTVLYMLTTILIILFGVLGYILVSTYREDKSAAREYNLYETDAYIKKDQVVNLDTIAVKIDEEVTTDTEVMPTEIYAEQIKIQQGINWKAFKDKNQNFVGIISIPYLNMWYPIVQNDEENPDFYLSHTYAGEKNPNGAIFLDYLFDSSYSDNHAILFGHNMKNMTMFGSLKTLMENDYKNSIFVYIYTEDQVLIYKAFASYLTEPDSTVYYAQLTDQLYTEYYKTAVENAIYKNVDDTVKEAFTKRNNILTMSTCHASDHSNYVVVQNILIERIIVNNEEIY